MSSMKAYAACSPGIPCVDYNIYENNSAAVDEEYNASKAGNAPPYTNTTGDTTTACDSNFMNQIYARAFLEGSREVIMSEQIIHKPDSVLEYTCFDKFINIAAHNAGTIFSESDRWANVNIDTITADNTETTTINSGGANEGIPEQIEYSVFSDQRLDTILADLLLNSLQTYIDNNFSHTFMGESTTIDNDIDTSSIGANSYECTHMYAIWNISRCLDFGEDDRFRSFKHLANFDPRTIPQSCSPGKESNDSIVAGNDEGKYEPIENVEDVTDALEDAIKDLSKTPSDLGTYSLDIPAVSASVNIDIDPEEKCPPEGDIIADLNTGISNNIIRLANNCDHPTNDDRLNIYSSFDIIKTYTTITKGGGRIYIPGTISTDLAAGAALVCSPPIPTGIPIITYGISSSISSSGMEQVDRKLFFHFEHICPNPGCYYQPVKVPYIWGAPIPSVSAGVCIPRL